MANEPAGFIEDLLDAVNRHDLEAVVTCFAESYVNETPAHPARSFAGRDQVRANWSAILGAVPDLSARVIDSAVAGDTIWSEWEMDGTRRDGNPHHMRGVMIFEVAGRQAERVRFYLEPLDEGSADISAAVQAQLGQAGARS